jgi:fumarylacetoacetate (FAA) hydrolase
MYMRLSTYKLHNSNQELIGLLEDDRIINLNAFFGEISLIKLIQISDWQEKVLNEIDNKILTKHELEDVTILSPIPKPNSFRDAYAFKQHVEASRRNRGVDMIKEFDEFPIFYFSNHNSIHGPNENIICMPSHFNKLDYELEIAILIGQEGSNILAKDADRYIAGYMILNDFSARDIQMQEMKLNLGPAKGKDFASVLGPYLVTPDEISKNLIKDNNNQGNRYNLKMSCLLNGELVSEGNTKDMHWTFEQIIERASYGVTLYPGDIIGSGTVGTGCLLELNGTHKLKNPNFKERWLKEGDVIEMKVDGLGEISNKIIANNSNYSII